MFDFRRMAISTGKCITKWRENIRMPLILFTIVLLATLAGGMYCATLWNTGQRLNVFEPFIAICHNYNMALPIMVGFLLINMDAPFFSGNDALHIFRLGRLNWGIGRIIYCSVIGFLIPFITAFFVSLLLSPFTFFYNEWSPAVVTLAQEMDAFSSPNIAFYFPPIILWDIIISTKPITAFLWTCTLLGLANASLTVIMMVLSMSYNRIMGAGICIILIVAGPFAPPGFEKWNIYQNGLFSLHRLTGNELAAANPSLEHSIVYFTALLIIGSIGMLIRVSKHGFKWGE